MSVKLENLRQSMLRNGQKTEARMIGILMASGHLRLALDEASWNVEEALTAIHCPISYSKDGTGAIAYCNMSYI